MNNHPSISSPSPVIPDEIDLFIVSDEEEGERLDKVLAAHFNGVYSRTYFQYLIDQQLIFLNGQQVKKRVKVKSGDEIEVQFAALPDISLVPENIPLSILYEDDFFLAVDKPAGMVVHPAAGNWNGTFANALLHHCGNLPDQDQSLRPGIVHRLDKDTSGVLIAAKTLEAQKRLISLFASRQIYKEYLAICVGRPADGIIDAPIGRHPIHRKQMTIVPTGRQAITICRTLGWNDKLSLVHLVIETGRTHQIRVHLKSQGTPIIGDPLYGSHSANQRYGNIKRQLLLASRLKFSHPFTGNLIDIEAAMPADMQPFVAELTRR